MSVEVATNPSPPPGLKLRCYTCFSLDRNLKPLTPEERFLVAMLCPEMFSYAKPNAQYLICWECEFMMVRIRRFQARLGKAHLRIKMNIQGVKTVVEGLSSLKITRVETINIIPPLPEIIPINQNQPSPNPPAMLKVEPITIKIEIEDREKYLSGDHVELIQPTKIQEESSDEATDTASEIDMNDDPLKTPKQKKVKVQMKYEKTDNMPSQNSIKDAIIPLNVTSEPQKVTINVSKENSTPRVYRQAVKVTHGVSNSVKSKDSVPILVKREGRSVPAVVKRKGRSVSNPVKGKGIVPTDPKHEEVTLKPPTGPTDLPMCGFVEEYDEVKCLILNKDELNKFRDAQRLKQGYKGCAYKCDTCIEKFNSQKNMEEHNKKHVLARGSHICEVCEQRFYDKSVRDDHYKLHFVVYQCLKCPYQSNDRLKISEHIRRNHEVSVFECKKCNIYFKTFREKRKHRVSVHAKRQPCEECNKTFTNRSQLTTHMAIHQRETTECPTCKKKVRNNYLETHMKSHDDTTEEGAYCVDCEKTFKTLKSYQSHLKTSLKHNTVEKVRIKCDHCDKYFSATGLKHHQEEIRGIKYTCDICKKDSKNKIILERHIRFVHKGQKPQPKPRICEYCGKSFTIKKCLVQHINSHLGNRTLVCKDCGATFVYSGSLYTHRRLVHKVKRKYEMKT